MSSADQVFALTIAGERCTLSASSLVRYATHPKSARTLERYDARAAEFLKASDVRLTIDDIRLTRLIYSRISEDEARWFVERSASAPWQGLPPKNELRSATGGSGLYQAALAIYDHFLAGRRRGIGVAKISKVIHLARPRFFPILDQHVMARYKTAATQVTPPPGSTAKRHFWLAVAEDLRDPRTAEGLKEIRSWARDHEANQVQRLATLSDVRLLDIATWEPQRNG